MHRFEPIADARPDDSPWPGMAWPVDPDVRLTGRFVELSLVDSARDGAGLFAALDHAQVWQHTSARPHTAEESSTSRSSTPAWRSARPPTRRRSGTLRRYQRRTDGSVSDTVMFSVTAEEWPGVKQGWRNASTARAVDSIT